MNETPQRKAEKKYRKKLKFISVTFYPDDMDIYDWLSKQPNKQGLIKYLIRQQIKPD